MTKAQQLAATAKKNTDIGKGIGSLLPTTPSIETPPDTGHPIKDEKEINRIARKDGSIETRVTLCMDEEIHERVKLLSYHERLTIKEIVNSALEKYINSYEAENGNLGPKNSTSTRKNKSRHF
jgi:hypothetical protein